MSLCNLPSISPPAVPNVMAALVSIFAGLGIPIPAMPAGPSIAMFCPLD
jgi:hypothetical protein